MSIDNILTILYVVAIVFVLLASGLLLVKAAICIFSGFTSTIPNAEGLPVKKSDAWTQGSELTPTGGLTCATRRWYSEVYKGGELTELPMTEEEKKINDERCAFKTPVVARIDEKGPWWRRSRILPSYMQI